MSLASIENQRLNEILIKDKIKKPSRFAEIVKKDVYLFLQNYFDILPNNFSVSISLSDFGQYEFVIKGTAKHLR